MPWLARFAPYLLVAAGWFLFSLIIPSAAGPADAIPRERLAAPVLANPASAAPLLIGSPRGAVLPILPAPLVEPPLAVSTAPAPTEIAAPAIEPAPALSARPSLPPTGRIVIPRINLTTKVIEVGVLPNGEMETAAYAVGRLAFSGEAGENGNVVLAGHNDVLGEVFRRLHEVQVGDEIVLYRGDAPFRYRVEGRTIVREQGATEAQRRENARWMEPTDEAVATLISCYPYRVDTHRYIVRARLVE